MQTAILVLFILVLVVDFMGSIDSKNPKISEMIIRAFMILAFVKILEWF